MKPKQLLLVFFASFILATFSQAQTKAVKDYLNVPGPVSFNGLSYYLAWTSHPAASFYKQEYVTAGDNVERFTNMILLDVRTDFTNCKDLVAAKVAELKKMKAANPLVNYESFENNGEYMLDFLLSANTPDGKSVSVVERNVYRYKNITDKSGRKAVLLFGFSTRAYGAGVAKFLTELKSKRTVLTNQVAKFTLPQIALAK